MVYTAPSLEIWSGEIDPCCGEMLCSQHVRPSSWLLYKMRGVFLEEVRHWCEESPSLAVRSLTQLPSLARQLTGSINRPRPIWWVSPSGPAPALTPLLRARPYPKPAVARSPADKTRRHALSAHAQALSLARLPLPCRGSRPRFTHRCRTIRAPDGTQTRPATGSVSTLTCARSHPNVNRGLGAACSADVAGNSPSSSRLALGWCSPRLTHRQKYHILYRNETDAASCIAAY